MYCLFDFLCICKPERTMSELMKKTCKDTGDQDIRQKLQHISNVMIKGREVSQHECIIKVLSIPLGRSNTSNFHTNRQTRKPGKNCKTNHVIHKMEEDDVDIY